MPYSEPHPPVRCDVAVVGGGIIGLAVARELILRHPRTSVCVLEREVAVGMHQSSHNSGVVHAGIHYRPGSLKAHLCVEGARELYAYCDQQGIASERCGKLIIATDPSELMRLQELERRATANGVPGMRRIGAAEIEPIEPHARGIAALYSPGTGVVDFPAVTRAYARDVLDSGGTIATGCGVKNVRTTSRYIRLVHDRGALESGHAIFCSGAWADRLAVIAGADPDPRIVPFRGAYLRLVPGRRHLVRSHIYPVPDPSVPFLGVHLSRHIDGEVLLGPTALIALARDAYRAGTIRRRDVLDTLTWPGTWRMLGRWWKTGLSELHHAALRGAVARAGARFLPELQPADVTPAFAGVRAQALGRDGALLDDFVFSATPRALHVRNAPSPGATASLAIARHVVEQAQLAFGLSS